MTVVSTLIEQNANGDMIHNRKLLWDEECNYHGRKIPFLNKKNEINFGLYKKASWFCKCDDAYKGKHCDIHCHHGIWKDNTCICDWNFVGDYCSIPDCHGHGYRPYVNGISTAQAGYELDCRCNNGWKGKECEERVTCGDHGKYSSELGECDCEFGWKAMTPTDECNVKCYWGIASAHGTCVCDAGYQGVECKKKIPCKHGVIHNEDGTCHCQNGYKGDDCSILCWNGTIDKFWEKCICDEHYYGDGCSEKKECYHGKVTKDGQCECDNGYDGDDCSVECVNGEVIIGTNTCKCNDGYQGNDCSEEIPITGCNGHGLRFDNKCECNNEWTGPNCSKRACNGNGFILNGKCLCDLEYKGDECSELACSGNGRLSDTRDKCVCDELHQGNDCSEVACNGHGYKNPENGDECVCFDGYKGDNCSENIKNNKQHLSMKRDPLSQLLATTQHKKSKFKQPFGESIASELKHNLDKVIDKNKRLEFSNQVKKCIHLVQSGFRYLKHMVSFKEYDEKIKLFK